MRQTVFLRIAFPRTALAFIVFPLIAFALGTFALTVVAGIPAAAQSPEFHITEADFIVHNYQFKSGETLPELRLHYATLGTPHRNAAGEVDNAVLMLHGTSATLHDDLTPEFGGRLFGPGQPLDTAKYFIILPDDIGHGKSSKPSDGLRMRFPKYDYDDMVATQKLTVESLGIHHLRLVQGTSMGCMQTFVWGTNYPGFVDNLMPMACLPVEVAGRNRINRYFEIQLIRTDPTWNNGNYTTQPHAMEVLHQLSIPSGDPVALQKAYPTRAQADAYVDKLMAPRPTTEDANDRIYQTDSSRNYNPAAKLKNITANVVWMNSEDDTTDPPQLHIAEERARDIPHGTFNRYEFTDAAVQRFVEDMRRPVG